MEAVGGAFLGWAVSASMTATVVFVKARVDLMKNFPEECKALNDLLEAQHLSDAIGKLDAWTDVPHRSHEAYRSDYQVLCNLLFEAYYIIHCRVPLVTESGALRRTKEWFTASIAQHVRTISGKVESQCKQENIVNQRFEWPKIDQATFSYQDDQDVPHPNARQGSDPNAAQVKDVSSTPEDIHDPILYQRSEETVAQVIEELKNTCNVAIVGMGKVGKTAIARAVYKKMTSGTRFTRSAWLTVGRDLDDKKTFLLMMNAFNQLYAPKRYSYSFDSGKSGLISLVNHLRKTPVLLVLDDVRLSHGRAVVDELNFATCPRDGCRHPGSRLIITTRQERVLQSATALGKSDLHPLLMDELEIFRVPPLGPKDARTVFEHYVCTDVAGAAQAPTFMTDDVKASCIDHCGGNPGALAELGKKVTELKAGNHSPEHCVEQLRKWREEDQQLLEQDYKRRENECGMYESLARSVDALPPSLRDCFTHFAAFPKGEWLPRVQLMHLFVTHGPFYSAESLVVAGHKLQELVRHNVVMSREQGDDKEFSLHSMLHGEALRRSCEESSMCCFHGHGEHRHCHRRQDAGVRFFSMQDDRCLRKEVKKCNHKEDSWHACIATGVKKDAFRQRWPSMKRLRFLHVGGWLGGLKHAHPCSANKREAPRHMLSYLCLAGYEGSDVQDVLERLVPHNSDSLIAHLDLSGCPHLRALPKSISRCSHLSHLCLSGCTSLVSVPDALADCTKLELLDVRGCTALQCLPKHILDASPKNRPQLLKDEGREFTANDPAAPAACTLAVGGRRNGTQHVVVNAGPASPPEEGSQSDSAASDPQPRTPNPGLSWLSCCSASDVV